MPETRTQDPTPVEQIDGLKPVQRNLVLERQMELACDVLREQSDTLRELAKR